MSSVNSYVDHWRNWDYNTGDTSEEDNPEPEPNIPVKDPLQVPKKDLPSGLHRSF